MPLYIAQSGDLEGCHACLTDGRTDGQTLKDRATQLLKKYKSGALVTQLEAILTVDLDITIVGFVSELRGESLFVG